MDDFKEKSPIFAYLRNMYLKELRIVNFKNLSEALLTFSPQINCICGNNGVGKTNLLDAVYSLSMTKSFFHYPDSFSIHHNEQNLLLSGKFEMDDKSVNNIVLSVSKAQNGSKNILSEKSLRRNDKIYSRFSDHIGLIPIVMVSPTDSSIINSSADERRRFINQLISQIDSEYLLNLQKYNKLLSQRNKLLKEDYQDELPSALLESFDFYLNQTSAYIYARRKEISELINDSISKYYSQLSGDRERVRISYDSDLHKGDFSEILKKNIAKDLQYKYTTSGIHRDDFIFEMENGDDFFPLKRVASQGQQKCFLIALKLAQFSIMHTLNGKVAPILLLDDIFDKLDFQRVELLLSLVSGEEFGQIFITDTNKERISHLVEKIGSNCKYFTVSDGVVE